MISNQHFVIFYSPGTFLDETSSFPIANWDTVVATRMAAGVLERYDAKPYGFRFETRLVSDPVSDGQGGTLKVESKLVKKSGIYYITGSLETLDDAEARNLANEEILRSNMRGNDMFIVCVNSNSWRSVHSFEESDFVVDAQGYIVERGDNPAYVDYRDKTKARVSKERGY